MLNRDKFFIGGQWVAPSTRDTIDVHNAGTGEVMGKVPAGSGKDIDAAVAAARAAFESNCLRQASGSTLPSATRGWRSRSSTSTRASPRSEARSPQGP